MNPLPAPLLFVIRDELSSELTAHINWLKPLRVQSQERLPLVPIQDTQSKTSRRLYNEEYFRVLKEYKQLEKLAKEESPTKAKLGAGLLTEEQPSPERVPEDGFDLQNLQLPKETMYLIDKVVRQRMQKGGPFGIQNSAVIGIELDNMRRANEANMSRLSGGRAVVLDEDGNPVVEHDDKENVNQELMERLGEACNEDIQGGDGKKRQLTFDEWKRRKEAEERIRAKLMEDALHDLKENLIRKEEQKKKLDFDKRMAVEQWELQKRRELEQKRYEQQQEKIQQEREKELKRKMSERTYRNWLSEKIKILKEEKYRKQEEAHQRRYEEERAKQEEETKRVAAEMTFKMWNKKLKKREKEQRRLERQREREAEIQLIHQRQNRHKGGVLLAYSLNKLLKKQPQGPVRPKTTKLKRRYSTDQNSVTPGRLPARELTPTVQNAIQEKIRIEDETVAMQRPRVMGAKKKSVGSKKGGGVKSKKGKVSAMEPGFEELSSIYPGLQQQSVESVLGVRGQGH